MKKLKTPILIFALATAVVLYSPDQADTDDMKIKSVQVAHSYGPMTITMDEFVTMGRVIVFGSNRKGIGKGQCPLCHTFNEGDPDGRGPNLFGIEKRSNSIIEGERYLNFPIKIGEKDPATGIVKGISYKLLKKYRRMSALGFIGEDYLRESLLCPDCYIVEGFGKDGDKKSSMPAMHKPPISLTPVEINAVIAWLQSKDDGDLSKVLVPLPEYDDYLDKEEGQPFKIIDEKTPINLLIKKLGCSVCHIIPDIDGAVGEHGSPLYLKTNGPKRLRDPRYKGTTKNVRDYTKESIVSPDAYIVANKKYGYDYIGGMMPKVYAQKLTPKALDKPVDFLINIEAPAEKNK